MPFYITPDYAPSSDGLYLFEKTVALKKGGKAVINIFAASRYILYINEAYICEGPCRGYEKIRYYDSVEVELKNGVDWKVDNDTFVIEIDSPADISKRLLLPDGKEYAFQAAKERFVLPM